MMLLLLNNTNNMYNRDHIMSKMTSKGYNLCVYVLWMWFLKFEKTVTLGYYPTYNQWLSKFVFYNTQYSNTVLECPKK